MIKELRGMAASSGKATGVVKIVLSEKDYKKITSQDILVCKTTLPDAVPILKKAKAVVSEEGSVLNHSAIFCREFGIPCVVGIKDATKVLKENKKITVDGTKGVVYC